MTQTSNKSSICSFSWYFGAMNRTEATNLLMSENEIGVFLVRNSTTIVGDLVLCVRSGLICMTN